MGLLNGSLQLGHSALATHQAALQVTGHNIANASTPGYTRLSPDLSPQVVGNAPVTIAGGVALETIQRNVDVAVEMRLRSSISEQGRASYLSEQLSRGEAIYGELGDQNISGRLGEFFNAFHQVSQTPHDLGQRRIALQSADSLASEIRRIRSDLLRLQDGLTEELPSLVTQANDLAASIAELNIEIAEASAGSLDQASALRDQRDQAINDLAELIDIQIREQENGAVNVYAGTDVLIQLGMVREFEATYDTVDGDVVTHMRFADNQDMLVPTGGQIAGLLQARDVELPRYLNRLDELASGLIFEVNRIHSEGVGLEGLSSAVSQYPVDPTVALNDAASGLPYPVQNGTLLVQVIDTGSGQVRTTQIEIDLDGQGGDTTLNDLAASLDAIAEISAQVTPDGRLEITSDNAAHQFAIADDDSNVMAALGVNALFTGSSAEDIDLSAALRNNPQLLAAGLNGEPGDGQNAARLAQLQELPSDTLNGLSIFDFHRSMISEIASNTASAEAASQTSSAVKSALTAQREAVSGVSLDEEAINLIEGQRAFQGAARYVSVVNQMLGELINLL
jgi:flagellar hook-associated protein 1 FlgK